MPALSAGLAALTLLLSASVVATPAASSEPLASVRAHPLPVIRVTVGNKHATVSGPTRVRPGRIEVRAKVPAKSGGEVNVQSYAAGYSFTSFLRDELYYYQHGGGDYRPTQRALRALRRALRGTHFFGGLGFTGHPHRTETVFLPKGTYDIVASGNGLPYVAETLHVTGSFVQRAAPATSATVSAVGRRRFAGPAVLPHAGTITFSNHADGGNRLLEFRQIANGTSRKTVAARYATLKTERSGRPAKWDRAGNFVTDSIGHGRSQTLSYSLPKGEYLELDFDPDPRTGNELAWQGMWRIVHLT